MLNTSILLVCPQAISPDVDSLGDLAAAAATVTEALTALLQQVRDGAQVMRRDQVEESYEALLAAARAVQKYVHVFARSLQTDVRAARAL